MACKLAHNSVTVLVTDVVSEMQLDAEARQKATRPKTRRACHPASTRRSALTGDYLISTWPFLGASSHTKVDAPQRTSVIAVEVEWREDRRVESRSFGDLDVAQCRLDDARTFI